MSERFDIAFGPGDCVCSDFADPRRLLGVNLPQGVEKILGDWLSGKLDPYSDPDLDSDTSSSGTESPSDRDSGSESNGKQRVGERKKQRVRERKADVELETKEGKLETKEGELPPGTLPPKATEPKTESGNPKISCLTFGSRLGEFAMVYYAKGHWFLDGNVFERLSTLEDWITLEVSDGGKIDHTRIKHRDGASLRLFLGPENTYFVYDGSTGEFHHNIQTREFRDWVNKCQKPVDEHMDMPDDRLILKLGSAPHSLTLGPNDMFCWICENDFKVNDSFRDVFPSIKIFLDYAKRRKMLSQVMFTTSTYNQPGSKQPYFVLSASDGVCVSSIPADASNVVSKSITGRYAVRSVRRMREMRETARLTQEAKDAKEKLESLDSDLDKALELAQSGDNELGPRARFDQRGDFLITYLKRISEDCDQNPINASDETWAKGSLADRVHLISEDRISKEKELTTLKAAYETIVSDLSEQISCMDEGERKRRLEAILKGKSP